MAVASNPSITGAFAHPSAPGQNVVLNTQWCFLPFSASGIITPVFPEPFICHPACSFIHCLPPAKFFVFSISVFTLFLLLEFRKGLLNQLQKNMVWWYQPFLLLTSITPPISSTSCLLMDIPKPVPPYLRAVVFSSCVNFWKRFFWKPSSMLMPVSVTLHNKCLLPAIVFRVNLQATNTYPFISKLTALLYKVSSTCVKTMRITYEYGQVSLVPSLISGVTLFLLHGGSLRSYSVWWHIVGFKAYIFKTEFACFHFWYRYVINHNQQVISGFVNGIQVKMLRAV